MRRCSLAWRIPGFVLVAALALAALHPTAALAAPTADAASTTISIDTPPTDATGSLRLYQTGWAADPSNPTGTGIDRVELYLDAPRGAGGVFLAQAEMRIARKANANAASEARAALSRSGSLLPSVMVSSRWMNNWHWSIARADWTR